ncbi:MAG: hypothetical protein R3A45_11995 [Bdellovibrionota bacterium]
MLLSLLGFMFAWWLNSVQGFHAVMNVVLLPMWVLSGAVFQLNLQVAEDAIFNVDQSVATGRYLIT